MKKTITCRRLRLCTRSCIHVDTTQVAVSLEFAAEATELALLHILSELTDNLLSDRDRGHLAAAIVAFLKLVPTCGDDKRIENEKLDERM